LGTDRSSLLEYCQTEDVLLTSYSPLGQGEILDNETLKRLASQLRKEPGTAGVKMVGRAESGYRYTKSQFGRTSERKPGFI